MLPTFRSDLTCSREEQQGVVFYRIDDPETKTSFRLYEIEYLIAQKLNGGRSLGQVIEAVKAEYNFDINEADLQKFISQLESMGFVKNLNGDMNTGTPTVPRPQALGAGGEGDTQTQEINRSDIAPERVAGVSQTLEMLDEAPVEVDEVELNRLLRTAFMYVRQGYLVHARDYLLAAKELSPSNRGLVRLVSAVEVMGDEAGPEETERLWNQCVEHFPEVTEDVGPLVEEMGEDSAAAKIAAQARRSNQAWTADINTRVRLSLLFLVLVVATAGGMYWAVKTLHLFEGAVRVRTQNLVANKVPVFYPGTAVGVRPLQEAWLSFTSAGKVGTQVPKNGTRVLAGDILATLDMPPKVAKQLQTLHDAVQKSTNDYERVAKNLEKVLADRQAAQSDKQAAEDKIKELRPKSVLKQDPAARKELEKWKKEMVKANRKLTALAKKERGPRGNELKVKKRIDAARKRLEAAEGKVADKMIRATFAGEIIDVKIAPGQAVDAAAPVVLLRDPAVTRLTFNVKDPTGLQAGGEALVSIQRGAPVKAKLVGVQQVRSGNEVSVELADPTGALMGQAPDSFRLVKEIADDAFRVRPKSLLGSDANAQVVVLREGLVSRQSVVVLQADSGDMLVRDPNGTLHNDEQVVVERLDGQDLSTMPDGTAVKAEEGK